MKIICSTIKSRCSLTLFFSLLSVLIIQSTDAASTKRVYLDITAPEIRKIEMAVPWFINKNTPEKGQSLDRDLAERL